MEKYHLQNRPEREIKSEDEIQQILRNGKFITFSMCNNNEPYIVTLSYGYDKEKNRMYFHCAKKGMKLDFIRANKNVCATIIEDKGYVTDKCAHNYRTLILRGEIFVVEGLEEQKYGMRVLVNHLESKPNAQQKWILAADKSYKVMAVLRFDIKWVMGKERK